MKRILIGIVFIVFSLTVGVISYTVMSKSCDEMTELLSVVTNAAVSDSRETDELCAAALKRWEEKKDAFHILVDHGEMDQLEISMQKMGYYSGHSDNKSVALYAEESKEYFAHIKETVRPSLSNVF